MKHFFKQFLPYYKNYKLKFVYSFLGMIALAISTAGTAYIMKPLLDDIFIGKNVSYLYYAPFVVIGIYTLKGVGRYVQNYYITYIGQDIVKRLRNKLLKNIIYRDLSFFKSSHSGDLMSRISNDIILLKTALSTHVATLLSQTLTAIALVFVVLYQNPILAMITLIIIPLMIYPVKIISKKLKTITSELQINNSKITRQLTEVFNNIEMIKSSTSEKKELISFQKLNEDDLKWVMKTTQQTGIISPIMEVLGAVAFSIIIIVGAYQVMNNQLTTGEFFSFTTAMFMLYEPVKKITTSYAAMQIAISAANRINELLLQEEHMEKDMLKMPSVVNNVTYINVTKNYNDKEVLKDLNVSLQKNKLVGIIGPSGSGKTTIINLLQKHEQITNGDILINEVSIKDISSKSLRQSISIVSQTPYILNDTILNNITYNQPLNETKLKDCIQKSKLQDLITELPNGINTIINQSGSNLSGGQKQRITIARALYKNPQIIIFDEATSALDEKTEEQIVKIIKEISKEKIVLFITHKLSNLQDVNEVYELKNQKLNLRKKV